MEPREFGVNANALPNVRELSLAFASTTTETINDETATIALMQWGQFVNHDMVGTSDATDVDADALCCGADDDDECFAINLPTDDAWFEKSTDCMEFRRAPFASARDCGDTEYTEYRRIVSHKYVDKIYSN